MSTLYQVLKPIVTAAVHIFYKKIEIVNRERLNEEGPTLIISNHNNAFLDAVVVEMFAKPQIYSIARGDVFGNPFVRSILIQLRILPIFRKEEGPGQMHKNEETFQKCVELLGKKQHIIMYPEGDCVTEKRLRKLRKGAARIALRAEAGNDFKLNLRVLPVGLNYSAAKKFRSNLFINIGNPISLHDYERQYADDKVRAVNNLTLHMEKEMRTLLVGLEHPANDPLYEEVLELSEHVSNQNLKDEHHANRHTASVINYFHHQHHAELQHLKVNLHDYHTTLTKLAIPVRLFNPKSIEAINMASAAKDLFLTGLGMPLHLVGIMFNYLPYRFAYRTADKKVKQAHFHASVNFVIGMFSWIGYYLLQLLMVGIISRSWLITLAFAFIIPATGLYSLQFYSFMKKTKARWNLLSLLQNNEALSKILLMNREELVSEIERMNETYRREKETTKSREHQFSNTIDSV